MIDTAMVLAAGLGTRFREVAGDRPKPLVPVAGRPLLDWVLAMLDDGGVKRAVVNIHYQPEMMRAHLQGIVAPKVDISDETTALMETGGGLMKATPLLGEGPVFCANTDAIMPFEGGRPVEALRSAWHDERMDALLLLIPLGQTSGYKGSGDFTLDTDGRLSWSGPGERFVYSGLQIIHPRLWSGLRPEAQSTTVFWNQAMAAGRLFGLVYDGRWMHIGDRPGFDRAVEELEGHAA